MCVVIFFYLPPQGRSHLEWRWPLWQLLAQCQLVVLWMDSCQGQIRWGRRVGVVRYYQANWRVFEPVPTGVLFRQGCRGEKWRPPAVLCLEKTPKDPCLSSTRSEISKAPSCIPQYTPGIFSDCCFCAVSQHACLSCCLFRVQDSVSYQAPAVPELSLPVFKVLGVTCRCF